MKMLAKRFDLMGYCRQHLQRLSLTFCAYAFGFSLVLTGTFGGSMLVSQTIGDLGLSGIQAQEAKTATPKIESEIKAAKEEAEKGLVLLGERKFGDAVKSFNTAFKGGDPDAGFYLGRMVELGIGVDADFDKARVLYLASADAGSAKALNRLGLMHFRGENVLQDYKVANELICKAGDLGDRDAQFNCAGMVADGKGVEADMEKAVSYYQLAAEQDHIGALNALGYAYRSGQGIEVDEAKALSNFEQTAAKGNPVGLYEYAIALETGNGVEQDLIKAHTYFNLAAARRHPLAGEALTRVTDLLDIVALTKAQEAARTWRAVE